MGSYLERYLVETNGANIFCFRHGTLLINEERRGPDQFAVVSLSDEKVRDVSPTDCAEPPVVCRSHNAVLASRGPICQQAWPYDGPVEPEGSYDPLLHVLVVVHSLQEQRKDHRVVRKTTMTTGVACTEARYRD